MPNDPQIIDLEDPEKAPRTTAIILVLCGLMGVGFYLVNKLFTGDDPYYDQTAWDEGDEPNQTRFDIMPNLIRGRPAQAQAEEEEEQQVPRTPKKTTKKPSTAPTSPYQLTKPAYKDPTDPKPTDPPP